MRFFAVGLLLFRRGLALFLRGLLERDLVLLRLPGLSSLGSGLGPGLGEVGRGFGLGFAGGGFGSTGSFGNGVPSPCGLGPLLC